MINKNELFSFSTKLVNKSREIIRPLFRSNITINSKYDNTPVTEADRKTEVALRASYAVLLSGFQVALVAPTTLLVRQHYNTFKERLSKYGKIINSLSRFTSSNEKKNIINNLKFGKIDLVLGTHALLSKEIEYKNLGLIIIDEEQHFGVNQKETIKSLKTNSHLLTLTATPIPRTLNMSLSGLKDLSLITTPPVDRLSIRTFVTNFDEITI